MFKFVVVCTLVAAAVAEPNTLFTSPFGYSNVVATAPAFYRSGYSNVVYSSPAVHAPHVYSEPLTHFIKKRSLAYVARTPLATTIAAAPFVRSYSAFSPLATSYAATFPTAYTTPLYATDAHLIKKRSVLVPSTYSYVAPTTYTATAPLVARSYAASPYVAYPYLSNYPLTFTTPFIKK